MLCLVPCGFATTAAALTNVAINGDFESPLALGFVTFTAPSNFLGWFCCERRSRYRRGQLLRACIGSSVAGSQLRGERFSFSERRHQARPGIPALDRAGAHRRRPQRLQSPQQDGPVGVIGEVIGL